MSLPLTALVASFAMSAPCFGAVTASAAPAPIIQAAASNSAFAQVGAPSLPAIEDEAPVALEDTPSDPYAVTPEDRETILIEAAAALSMVKTAKGQFTQVAPDFSISTGEYALRRPGRMRFSYDDPTPLLIVSDGTTVAIEDRDLETVDRVPLASTPLGLVLDDRLDFTNEADVTGVQRADGLVAISMRDRSGEAEGELTLILDDTSYELLSWRAVDEAGGITSVQLAETETNVSLSPRLFRLDDPEDEDERRR